MKKLLFLLAILCTLQANAQPYSISFSGSGLSTIKVQNLTTNVIVDVPAGDVLLLSTPTGIPKVNNMKSSEMKVYPNPMTDKSTLEIIPPVEGDAIISVYDITGKVLTQFKCHLENCTQEFSLSGIKNGLHIINVQGNGYQFSEKLLSNGRSNGTVIIARVSNNIQTVAEKKSIQDSKGVENSVEMAYNAGERLKFTALSGNNSTVMTDIPSASKTVTFTFTECKDGYGNNYPVVAIGIGKSGPQLWMAENLKTTNYNDGTAIPNVTGNTAWAALTTGAYCDFNDTPANSTTYGRLYNWYAVDNNAATKVASNGGKNVCPTGWHVPNNAEWTTLENYLIANGYNFDGTTTGNKIAKALASTTLWTSDAGAGTVGNTDYPAKRNATGFTALPGGGRDDGGEYPEIGDTGYWWSSTEYSSGSAWYRLMFYKWTNVDRGGFSKQSGCSVRCVKD
jgi:uncharacterized protein (TIGR02145 family)